MPASGFRQINCSLSAADPRIASPVATSYLGYVDEPIIAPAALKHGLDEEQIRHAYRNPVLVWDLGDGFTMIVGPNQAAIFLRPGRAQVHVIVHAMHAREKFLR